MINVNASRSHFRFVPGRFILLFLVLSAPATALGQVSNMLSMALVEQRLASLREGGRAADSEIVVAYEQVQDLLVQVESHNQDAADHLESMTTAKQRESVMQARIDTIEKDVHTDENLAELTNAELEARLVILRVELAETNNGLDELETRLATREATAAEIRTRLGQISPLIESSTNEPLSIDPVGQPSLAEAQRWIAAAELHLLRAEKSALETRLTSQPARYSAMAVARAEATLNAGRLSQLVHRLENHLRKNVAAALSAESMGIAADDPVYELANRLAASDAELREENIAINDSLADARRGIEEINRQSRSLGESYATARRVVDFAGDSDILGSVLLAHWREIDQYRLDDPTTSLPHNIGETVIRRIELEETLKLLSSATAYVNKRLESQGIAPASVAEPTRAALVQLVQGYRERLRNIMAIKSEYIDVLGNLGEDYLSLNRELDEYESYLKALILWFPAYPPLWDIDKDSVPTELTALNTALKTTRFSPQPITLGIVLALLLLLSQRRWLETCEETMRARIARPRDDAIQHSLVALACVALRAATVPLALLAIASALSLPALVKAIVDTAILLFVMRSMQLLCKSTGVGPAHFSWPETVVARIYRELTWLILWWLPAFLLTLLVVLTTAETGEAIVSRLAVISVTLMSMGLFAASLYRGARAEPTNWLRDISNQVRLFLIAALLTLFMAVLLGHVYSVDVIFKGLIYTVFIGYPLFLFHALLMRWVTVARRRIRLAELMDARTDHDSTEDQLSGENAANLVDVTTETSEFINMAILVAAAVALFYIWSPLLPAFDAFSSITLWTSTAVVDGQNVDNRISLAMLIIVILLASLTIYGARKLPALIDLMLRSRTSVTESARYTVSALLNYVILGGGFIAALSALGLQWSQLQWLVAALGVGIGFGLQEIIANFISGIIILFERPIRVGDIVSTGGNDGVVSRIRIRATTLVDWDGKELLVPNKEFITGRLLNWSLTDPKIRIVLPVGIAYGSDVELAIKTLDGIVREHKRVIDEPAPQIVFESFGDNALMLSARCFLDSLDNRWGAVTELNREIYKRFAEAGIVIAFPQRDIHFDSDKPIRIDLGPAPGQP